LAEDCPDWRVWLADAPTALSPWFGSSLACTDAANNLLMRLRIARLGQRPVAWIGHSLGGLLIKALLLEAQTQPLSRKTRGVIFMGTPHWGSAWATRGLWLAHCSRWWLRWLRSAPLLHELRAESPGLRDLHTRYRRLAAARRWRHRSFSEQPLRWLGSIVPPSSADVGLADNDSIPVAADHLTLCKPASRMSIVYRGTVDFLEQLAA
jgi:pimeloyl-ACP methyl ester carboxylesterase